MHHHPVLLFHTHFDLCVATQQVGMATSTITP